MSEEQMSKRERQKARKQAKREAQVRAARQDRTKRFATIGLIAIVALGLVGYALRNPVQNFIDLRQARAQSDTLIAEYGCTPIEEIPNMGGGHLTGDAASLEAADPREMYDTRPATSGTHHPGVVITGVFDKVVDERILIHNLEHGYIVIYHDPEAPEEEVDELRSWAERQIDSRSFEKMIVTEFDESLPGDANFAFTAWDFRQICERFNPQLALLFSQEHHYFAGRAPERELTPHMTAGGGIIDPDDVDGDYLFPPLGDVGAVPEGIDHDADSDEADPADEGDLDEVEDDEADPDDQTDDPAADADDTDDEPTS